MTDLQTQFNEAVDKVRNAPSDGDFKPSTEYQLKMYSLYRQATDGDVSGKRPGVINVIARAKYDAWSKAKGMSKEDAMQAYIDEVNKVEEQYG